MQASDLKVKLFVDSGDIQQMRQWIGCGVCQGATSNPSLAKKAGVLDYLAFCKDAALACGKLPISLEVVADDPQEILRQARLLASIGDNVFVKVPIVTCSGISNLPLVRTLVDDGIKVNVTAMFHSKHIDGAWQHLHKSTTPHFVSIFCGRVLDSGREPGPTVRHAADAFRGTTTEIIWASVRQPYDVLLAAKYRADVVTVFPDMLKKLHLFGKDLDEFAAETSAMFYQDALAAGYAL